jgi:CRISPR-associated endonuclease Csn1
MTKKILGLDLGTNSIGWALVNQDFENKQGDIEGLGSRIIPMSQDVIGEFGKGNSISQTAERTGYRGVRRLRERHLLRRERLHRVLNVLGFLPEHYANDIDFEKRLGQFKPNREPKLAYKNNEFLFKKSFEEMLDDFRKHQPELLKRKNRNGENVKIPYDWTIYYLRKKALFEKIEKEELAWIILNFNQKRGYYQLRGEEEEEQKNKIVEFYSLKVTDVVADEESNKKGELWYSVVLENGWVYRRSSKIPLDDWKNKTKDFIVTTTLNDDGSVKVDKEGEEKRSFRAPKEDDWTLIKKKTEQDIKSSGKTVGTYIYDSILNNPKQKIRGKLVRTVERKLYRDEFKAILKKQIELQPELFSDNAYNKCTRELYQHNEAHRFKLSKHDFVHLFVNDIIFYQRPLRSKKSSINNCAFEYRKFKVDGEDRKQYLKAIPKSNPYYQEFRVWQWLTNLKIYLKDNDEDVTKQFIKRNEDIEALFEFLMQQKEVDHKAVLKYFFSDLKGKAQKEQIAKYRWNYVYDLAKDESKKYPMNETGYAIKKRLDKVENISSEFLTKEIEYQLWHIIYSVIDKVEYEKALKTFAKKHDIDEDSFLENFLKFPPFASDYGTFSEKAIKKLLALLRTGKFWAWESIDKNTQERIQKIITGEFDENIENKVREKLLEYNKESDFQGIELWLAQYVVYGTSANNTKWKTLADIHKYLSDFKQHSLRNPIVEQVLTETLRVVHDIWKHYGEGKENYFDEIHVELGREMKNPAEKRKNITERNTENENTNQRIKALLAEMAESNTENVRPYSPMQQEILKIYEDGVLNSDIEIDDDIQKISQKPVPTKSELNRYKLWLEQKYRSPYTGEIIPLGKLFTSEYEIEHVIPQSRYFDDSLTNKVICESAVNKLKDNQLGFEFIKNHHGTILETGQGKAVKIFDEEAYDQFVKQHYAKNRAKRNKLLLEDIPEKMIERQMNDTRYISKYISSLLSNIVRTEQKDEGLNSVNLIPCNGKVTSQLKRDWGLNDVWNDLILPRFERMNKITNSKDFTSWNERHQKHLPTVPLELSKGFQKKRIDHRHHAMDALIVACATRSHVNLLNNQYAKSKVRYDLNRKLRRYEKVEYNNPKTGKRIQREVPKEFLKPWANFTVDAKNGLEKIVISFKQNLRVINKATNKYESYKDENGKIRTDENGKPKKGFVTQTKGDNWAIRKALHKETVSGEVDLPWVKIPKGKVLTATRKSVDTSFNPKNIDSITDKGIQKILTNYLKSKDNNPEIAFSHEGLEDMNKNISMYNDGKPHKPIKKVRVYEVGSKFNLGQSGNKKDKYVEAAKGTNLFFAIYWDESKRKRTYETVPLNFVIERQKQGLSPVAEINEKGNSLLFYLSPNDLVYVPTEEEALNPHVVDFKSLTAEQLKRLYKMISSSTYQCFFINARVAISIANKKEFSTLNKMEKSIDDIMIKDCCWKLKVDRLGNISKA